MRASTDREARGSEPPSTGDWSREDFVRVSNEELARLASTNVLENAAYFELWRRHHGLVAGLVHRRLHGQDAEHTITTFFCHKLPRVLHQFPPASNPGIPFEAWLRTVVRNYLNDEWRRGKTRRSRQVPLDGERGEAIRRSATYAHAPQVERQTEREHLVYFLREIMKQLLNPEDRYIFHAHYWEEKTFKLIALELGMTEENVRVRHYRAKKRLAVICEAYRKAGVL